MEKMIAYCGLTCTECPTLIATQKDDDHEREKVVKKWSKMFNMNLTTKDINCNGCKSNTGLLFGHCNNCQVKKCCSEKGFETCASCEEYACETLSGFLAFVPHAKDTLEKMRKDINLR